MSEFAQALKGLLDDTNLFDRHEWSDFFTCVPSTIDAWLADERIPRYYCLNMLVTCLECSSDVKKEPVEAFMVMANKPARQVSPHGCRMLPTVLEYMIRPIFCELSSKLAKMNPEEQAIFLDKEFPHEV